MKTTMIVLFISSYLFFSNRLFGQTDANYVDPVKVLQAENKLLRNQLQIRIDRILVLEAENKALIDREANGQPDNLDALYDLYGKYLYVTGNEVVNTFLTDLLFFVEQPLQNPANIPDTYRKLQPAKIPTTNQFYERLLPNKTWSSLRPGLICEMRGLIVDDVINGWIYMVHMGEGESYQGYTLRVNIDDEYYKKIKFKKGDIVKPELFYNEYLNNLLFARPITKREFGEFIKYNKVVVGFNKISNEEAKLHLDAIILKDRRFEAIGGQPMPDTYFLPSYLKPPTMLDAQLSRLVSKSSTQPSTLPKLIPVTQPTSQPAYNKVQS